MNPRNAISIVCIVAASLAQVRAECSSETCRFGGSCQPKSIDSTEIECVCPTYPCTPEYGSATVVCGDDDVTYTNMCEMRDAVCAQQKWISPRHEGPCGEETCTTKWDCLYTGRCINGKCVCEECRDVMDRRVYYVGEFNHAGASKAWKRTSVCGDDGVTYESECHLNYHACMSKTLVMMAKWGICNQDRDFFLRSAQESTSFDIIERPVVEAPKQTNCSTVQFHHCVSKRHPRLKYMGTFVKQNDSQHLNGAVYKMTRYGSVKSTTSKRKVEDAYLSRHVTNRHPDGIWIVGSKVSSGRGWLGVSDPSMEPENVRNMWRVTEHKRGVERWVNEPSLSLRCEEEQNFECLDSVQFDGTEDSNWQHLVPPTPFYELNVVRPTKGKFRNGGKIVLELRAKRKTKRYRGYILRISTDRPACGIPKLLGKKNRSRHVERCDGGIVMTKHRNKKMMKTKFRFKAPSYGCITVSATVLSARGFIYKDDILTKTLCSKST